MSVAHKLENVAVLKPRTETRKPPLYKVVMLNDDFTPMDFVVELLKKVFYKSQDEALRLMLEIHNRGLAVVGVYTRDIAETKADVAMHSARRQEHPLQCLVEHE